MGSMKFMFAHYEGDNPAGALQEVLKSFMDDETDSLSAEQEQDGGVSVPKETCGKAGCNKPAPHFIPHGNMNYYACDEHLAEINRKCGY